MKEDSNPNIEPSDRTEISRAKAEKLRLLHQGPSILVLANVWNAVSARVVEKAGAPALATTSAGIANALGYADGQHIPEQEMLWMIRRIVNSVRAPVTADMEAGYATMPNAMAATTERLLETGAVGMNLEDRHPGEEELVEVPLQVEKIKAVLETARKYGIPLVLNARTDAFMPGIRPLADPLKEAIRRANIYRQAGADCVFVPGVSDIQVIQRLLAGSPGPLNVLASPRTPSIRELESAGVRRVSMGSAPHAAVAGFHRELIARVMTSGSFEPLGENAISYVDLNRLFAGRANPGPNGDAGKR